MLNRGNKENDKTLNTLCTTFSRTEETKKMIDTTYNLHNLLSSLQNFDTEGQVILKTFNVSCM